MSDPNSETTTQLTVRVVTGCSWCQHLGALPRTKGCKDDGCKIHFGGACCRHPSMGGLLIRFTERRLATDDTPPPECPLRLKEGERLEVVLP